MKINNLTKVLLAPLAFEHSPVPPSHPEESTPKTLDKLVLETAQRV